MIKTQKAKILSLALILFLLFQLLVLVSCASPGGSADTSDDQQMTDADVAGTISLALDGEALYSLVRPCFYIRLSGRYPLFVVAVLGQGYEN